MDGATVVRTSVYLLLATGPWALKAMGAAGVVGCGLLTLRLERPRDAMAAGVVLILLMALSGARDFMTSSTPPSAYGSGLESPTV